MLTYSLLVVSFTQPLTHPATHDSNPLIYPTSMQRALHLPPLCSPTPQTHALSAMREPWKMLSEAWGLVQVGSGLCSETGPGPKTDERILFFFFSNTLNYGSSV